MPRAVAANSRRKAQPGTRRAKKGSPTVYTVVVTRERDGRYVVCAPALNGCGSYGDTLPEALRHAEEAIALYLEVQRELGWPVPPDDPQVCVDMTDVTEACLYRLVIPEEREVA